MIANWGVHLFHATWQSGVVALVVLAIVRALPRLSSRVRYALLCLAMLKFALPPMLTFPLGAFSALPPVGSAFFWPAERTFVFGSRTVLGLLMAMHAAGAVLVVAMLIARALKMHALIRRAVLEASFLRSTEADVPFVYGLFRPVVVLPARPMTGDEMSDALAHESMHLAQNDSRHAALQSALAIVWWWNPLYWMIAAELSRVREERCDDAVLAAGYSTARRYSHSIIGIAAGASSVPAVAMARHPLEPRLRRLADNGLKRSTRLSRLQLILLLLAALVFLPGVGRSPAHGRAIHLHQH